MEGRLILLDTSILIEFFRRKNKANSLLYKLRANGALVAVSSISVFEIYTGSTPAQREYWGNVFSEMHIYAFDENAALHAANIDNKLKGSRNQIAVPDLFIASIAVTNNLPLATLNKRHFSRVEGLELVSLN